MDKDSSLVDASKFGYAKKGAIYKDSSVVDEFELGGEDIGMAAVMSIDNMSIVYPAGVHDDNAISSHSSHLSSIDKHEYCLLFPHLQEIFGKKQKSH